VNNPAGDPSNPRMKRAWWSGLVSIAGLGLVLGLTPVGASASSGESRAPAAGGSAGVVLERLTDLGSSIRLGFGVSPLHGALAPTPTGLAGVQESESGTVVSFDLNLAWPGASRTSAVVPYVMLGPALFVVEPDSAGRLLGTRVDPTLQLGARAGAGVNWRLSPRATLFGGYEITTTAPGGLTSPGTRTPGDNGVTGHDFTGGLKLIY
jgi:hypothetical protein